MTTIYEMKIRIQPHIMWRG